MSDKIQLYVNCLSEINKRIEVIEDHLDKKNVEKYVVTEVEFLCLQFRKVLEKIALASMVANNEIYKQHYEKFAQHYHAKRILNDIEKINSNFYPISEKQVTKELNGNVVTEIQPLLEGYLTKNDFINVYEICGGMLHAENPYGNQKQYKDISEKFPIWLNQIFKLIYQHHITLVDGTLLVGLLRDKNGISHAAILTPN